MDYKIEDFYNHPHVLHNEWEDLVIFFYSRECQYDKIWDDITRAARGIIFNKKTGELISKSYEKFFNLNEMPESCLENLPKGKFTSSVKKDGSLGISFFYKDQWYITTKGSFKSEMGQWATVWFRKNVNVSAIKREYTYLFEIIYPENRIVIDYGDFEGLVLLGCIETKTSLEMPYSALIAEAEALGVTLTEIQTDYDNVEDLYIFCKGLPHNQEGFVLTFENGLKVKMKGDDYCKIHKLLSCMTPLAFWEAWDLNIQEIPKSFLAGLPEEFRDICDNLNDMIQRLHMDIYEDVQEALKDLYSRLGEDVDAKTLAIEAKDKYKDIMTFIMHWYNKKYSKFWYSIHQRVRPTFNQLPDDIKGADRINRIKQS